MTTMSEILERRELVVNLTQRDLKSRYKRSVLGWTWSLLNPISTVLVYSLVFQVILRAVPAPGDPSGQTTFALYLVAALVPWNFFAGGINSGLGSLVSSSQLIRKTWFPREIVVLATVGSLLVTMAIEMVVVMGFALVLGNNVLPWIPLILVLVAIQTVWVTGLAFALSVLNVYFRDMQYLIGHVLLQLLFYLIPVVYPVRLVEEQLPGWAFTLYKLNPMYQFVEAYRNLIWDLRMPTASTWLYLIIGAALSLWIGLRVFRRYEPRLAEVL
jgi:ABC-type polysaccharide/polyol phosphate export permease